MAEIPGLPPYKKRKPAKRKRVTTTPEYVAKGPLVPWMHRYLHWLAAEPSACLTGQGKSGVTLSQKTAQASLVSKRRISTNMIRQFELRPDVLEYFTKLRSDVQFMAKEMLQQDIATSIEARREGLHQARGYVKVEKQVEVRPGETVTTVQEVFSPLAVDHRAIKGYTDYVVDVAFPKKAPEDGKQASVVIHIGDKTAARLIDNALAQARLPSPEVLDVEVEELPPQPKTEEQE